MRISEALLKVLGGTSVRHWHIDECPSKQRDDPHLTPQTVHKTVNLGEFLCDRDDYGLPSEHLEGHIGRSMITILSGRGHGLLPGDVSALDLV